MIEMDRSKHNLNKLKAYHIPDHEIELYKQKNKNRYLRQYADISVKSEDLSRNSVYDPKGLDDFFTMHESASLREYSKSRRVSLKNNLSLKFQAVSLLLVFIVIIAGNIISSYHSAGFGAAHDIDIARAERASTGRPLEPVEFNKELYDYINNIFDVTIETLNQNINATNNVGEERIRMLTNKFNMIYIDQNEIGMPNGCEITSLAMVLSRDYRDISVHEISEQYLEKKPLVFSNGLRFGDDPTYYYIGNPEDLRGGFGIFAPGLTNTANKIIQSRGIRRTAYDISGCSGEELLAHVSQHPVIIWYTLNLQPVRWGLATWHLPDNRAYSYPLNNHCAVLAAYTDTTVILYDPIYGIIEHDRELFLRRWDEIGPYRDKTRQAVIIR
jgi:uncharacterized protein YvpB